MHKLADRQLKGLSQKLEGCVLDAPNKVGPIMHHVYCSNNQRLFRLTNQVYWETVKEIDRKRRNDVHRMIDESLKFGDYIYFTYDNDNYIVDYERATNIEDGFTVDGTYVFKSQCVFHPKLDRLYTDHFGQIPVADTLFEELGEIPTPNVAIFCFLSFNIIDGLKIQPWLFRILEVNGEDQSFVMKCPWYKAGKSSYQFTSDDEDVQLEEDLKNNIGALTKMTALITGYTAVYLVDKPSISAILPKFSPFKHNIGHEAQVDLIFNDVLQCYVVFAMSEHRSHYYMTRYTKTSDGDIGALFYVDLYAGEIRNGFYKNPHLGYIADPWGYLDISYALHTKFFTKETLPLGQRHFYVPVLDRLGTRHESRQLQTLGLVTRFEVASPGDQKKQLDLLDFKIRKIMELETNVIVLDSNEGLLYSKRFHNCLFYLKEEHNYPTGIMLKIKARRIPDPDSLIPTFVVTSHCRLDDFVVFKNEKFYLPARFDNDMNCYENQCFGYIPSGDKEKPQKSKFSEDDYPYIISAKINRQYWAQTPLYDGRFYSNNKTKRKP